MSGKFFWNPCQVCNTWFNANGLKDHICPTCISQGKDKPQDQRQDDDEFFRELFGENESEVNAA